MIPNMITAMNSNSDQDFLTQCGIEPALIESTALPVTKEQVNYFESLQGIFHLLEFPHG